MLLMGLQLQETEYKLPGAIESQNAEENEDVCRILDEMKHSYKNNAFYTKLVCERST